MYAYRNATDFHVILCSLLLCCILFLSFLENLLGFCMYIIMTSENSNSLVSFTMRTPSISFSCLITVVRTSILCWIIVVKVNIPNYSTPDITENSFNFSSWNTVLVVDLLYMAFLLYWDKFLLYPFWTEFLPLMETKTQKNSKYL